MARKILPQRRRSETFFMHHGKHKFQVTVGYFTTEEIGEVFISGAKTGSEMDALCRDAAILLSLALQHGTPLDIIRHAITREANGEASTIIGAVVDKLMQQQ